jgi:hypothetical protein
MAKIMLGAFENIDDADAALYELDTLGYKPHQISVISSRKEYSGRTADTAEGAIEGAKTGGIIGGLAGILAGVGIIPALAGLFIAGPITGWLGLAGLASTAVAGAVTGAVAGGLIGALVKAGVPRETAEYYNRIVTEGGVLLGVSNELIGSDVQMVFEKHNARNIQVMDMAEDDHEALTRQQMRQPEPAFGETLDDERL